MIKSYKKYKNNQVCFNKLNLNKKDDLIEIKTNELNIKDDEIDKIVNIITDKIKNKDDKLKKIKLSTIATILSIIFTFCCIISYLFPYKSKIINRFEFSKVSDFETQYGILKDKKELHKYSDEIIKINNWISNNNREKLVKIIDPSSFGYMLHGPPGTGKSLFVQALAYLINLKLKMIYLRKNMKLEEIDSITMYSDLSDIITRSKSKVEYLMITPSLINDKYVGESEKNVKQLFKELYDFNDPYTIRIVFFDECEAFFSKRSDKNSRSNSEVCVQTEFLTKISQHGENIKGVFLFAATNMPHLIDDAFKRRFGNKCEFEKPKLYSEIVDLIKSVLVELSEEKSDKYAKEVVHVFKNTSQAFITRTCKRYILRNEYGKAIKFDSKSCLKDVRNIQRNERI
ncbi:VPS4 [Hepatospora eriocheir]|uniref:VPS4 n=1 Tax=Hepatospora eriocheir TaxID=1081669 RepID=A0A1X0QJJ9_9MICR|nr:VPS4 [Hepatospora eriocheir]